MRRESPQRDRNFIRVSGTDFMCSRDLKLQLFTIGSNVRCLKR
jgi:hypothetical protein